MRRFLIPAIVLAVAMAVVLAYLLIFISPFEGAVPQISLFHNRIVAFLLSTFFFLTSLFSLILYLAHRLLGDYMDPRFTYRRSLRQAALIGLAFVVVAVLFLTRTANVITVALTIGVIVSLEFTLRS